MKTSSPSLALERVPPPTALPSANFDRVARLYRWAEYLALGPLLRLTREHFLPHLTAIRHALVLGDGDGRFAARLLLAAPHCRISAVDSSAVMLELLRARCTRTSDRSRVQTKQVSVLDTNVDRDCDLIATHFLLDCLTQDEVNALAKRLAGEVQPRCRWVLSEFCIPPGRVAGPLGAAYIRLLYLAFRALTGLRVQQLPDPQLALGKAGFVRLARSERLCGLVYAELWQLE